MKHTRSILTIVVCTAGWVYGQASTPSPATDQDKRPTTQNTTGTRDRIGTPQGTAADNTRVNQRDRQPGAKTADQQKETKADRELTQKIRKSLMDDKNLSAYAKNVKIISANGAVTVKGPVRSADEKKTVVAMAVAVAGGADKVTDEISIAP